MLLYIEYLHLKYYKLIEQIKSINDNVNCRISEFLYKQNEVNNNIYHIISDIEHKFDKELSLLKSDYENYNKEKDMIRIDIDKLKIKQKETSEYIAINIVRLITHIDELEIIVKENNERCIHNICNKIE